MDSNNRFYELYGKIIATDGVTPIPMALFRYQAELKLTSDELAFICYLLTFRWMPGTLPHPSLVGMAENTGVNLRTLQRHKNSLVAKGYLAVIARKDEKSGQLTNGYDFTPLFQRLEQLIEAKNHSQPTTGLVFDAQPTPLSFCQGGDDKMTPPPDTGVRGGMTPVSPGINNTSRYIPDDATHHPGGSRPAAALPDERGIISGQGTEPGKGLAAEPVGNGAVKAADCSGTRVGAVGAGESGQDALQSPPTKRGDHPGSVADGAGRSECGGPVSNRALIAELTEEYRKVVPAELHRKGDYAFVGRLYNEFGYDRVLVGINDLGYKVDAGLAPESPLVYLRGIVQKGGVDDGGIAGRERTKTKSCKPQPKGPKGWPCILDPKYLSP
jgi:hypothetical protein